MKKKTEIVQWKIPTVPNEKALAKQRDSLLGQANSFSITSEDHFVASWAIVQRIDSAIASFDTAFEPLVAGLYRLHKLAIKLRDSFLDPLYAAKQRLMLLRRVYREDAEKAKAKADALAAKALQKAQDKELETQAKQLEKAGEPQAAIAVREQKGQAPLFFNSAPAVPKQEGSVIKKRWIYEVLDPDAVQREYCSPDPKKIRPVVESLGEACNIKGLRITLDESEHSRTVA